MLKRSGAPLLYIFSLLYLEAQVVPSRVDLARPLHGLALDQVDPKAVAEEPIVCFFLCEVRAEGARRGRVRRKSVVTPGGRGRGKKRSRSKKKKGLRDHWRLSASPAHQEETDSVFALSGFFPLFFARTSESVESSSSCQRKGQKRSCRPFERRSRKKKQNELEEKKQKHALRRRLLLETIQKKTSVSPPAFARTSTRQSRTETAS